MEMLRLEKPSGKGGGGVNSKYHIYSKEYKHFVCSLKVYLDSLIETSCSRVLLMKPMNI